VSLLYGWLFTVGSLYSSKACVNYVTETLGDGGCLATVGWHGQMKAAGAFNGVKHAHATTDRRYSGNGCKAEDFNTAARAFPGEFLLTRPCGLGAARLPPSGSCPDRLSD
jgi:hypothetical protein